MRILIVYPAVSGLKNGNLVTAERWQKQFLELGHTVEIAASFDDADQGSNAEIDLMVALHATKSAASIEKCRAAKSGCQIFVVLTGTDIYDPESRSKVQQSLTMADQIVVLQTATAEDVPTEHREKVNVIFQSIEPRPRLVQNTGQFFEVCVVGHLRPVKDPFQAAHAARDLPAESKIRITQIGGAMTDHMKSAAEKEAEENPRYRWIGEVTRDEAMQQIAGSDLLVNSSLIEGGAAVVCESVVAGTPILATQIAGNVGFLGDDYEGLFNVGDTNRLRELMFKAETNGDFHRRLQEQCDQRKHLFEPDFEQRTWATLLEKVNPSQK